MAVQRMAIVTQHRWERHGIILISNEHVRMADASSDHPDDYIVRTRRVDTSPLDLEPSPFLPHDSYRDIVPRFHVGVRHYKIRNSSSREARRTLD